MKSLLPVVAIGLLTAGCAEKPDSSQSSTPAASPLLLSGIDRAGMDLSIRPQDDFFAYANGQWLEDNEIPDDRTSWGSFQILRDNGLSQLRTIVEESADSSADADARKIGAFYSAWMNTDRVRELGTAPIADLLQAVDELVDHADVARFMGTMSEMGIDAPLGMYVGQDRKNPDSYILIVQQSGLGLPDRDYYFDESERGQAILDAYREYARTLLQLAGHSNSTDAADAILALETQIAAGHWDNVKTRDANLTYNKVTGDEFKRTLVDFATADYLSALGVGQPAQLVVRQPSYVQSFNTLFPETSVATWKNYLQLRVLGSFAEYLDEPFVSADFEFYNRTLRGQKTQQERWKRAIDSLNANAGEMLGRVYVEKHFPPEAKARMDQLVANLIRAYDESIRQLEWMSDETKAKALQKLDKFSPMIGYPDRWRDYSALDFSPDSLVANIRAARRFDHFRQIDKLGKPVDRGEWFMSPQTVNAYYNPPANQIVFPAAILQPPFFDMRADDARNYGAIGMVIGHEIGHGFDDQGSKYDGDGNLRNWWLDADRQQFEERTSALVAQYAAFEALPGLAVNGELTLGENIGDLGGTAIALRAYELSLDGNEAPIIDGMTGAERFFLGLAQVWRSKYRDEAIELQVKSDPHSPAYFRVNGVVRNIDAFYEAFDVNPGDTHYLAEDERVRIWR